MHIINTLCRPNGRVCSRPQIKKFKLHFKASMRRTTITALESRIKKLKRLMFIYYYRFTTYIHRYIHYIIHTRHIPTYYIYITYRYRWLQVTALDTEILQVYKTTCRGAPPSADADKINEKLTNKEKTIFSNIANRPSLFAHLRRS